MLAVPPFTEAARAWPSAEASPTQTSEQGAEQAPAGTVRERAAVLVIFHPLGMMD